MWKTDGTPAQQVKDELTYAAGFTNVHGNLFFTTTNWIAGGTGLWKSDGPPAGMVKIAGVNAQNLTAVGATLFFAAPDATNPAATALWKSNGTAKDIVEVKNVNPTNLTDVAGETKSQLSLLAEVG